MHNHDENDLPRAGAAPSALPRRLILAVAAGTAGGTTVALSQVGRAAAADTGLDGPREAPLVTITPDDLRYPDVVRGVDQRWVGQPESVHMVNSTQQVIDTVQSAARAGKRLTVKGGGHCYEDFVFNPDVQVIVDMSALNAVYWDPAQQAFAVESGATLLNVYDQLYRQWGVVIPAGICYSVGAGGHIPGGGWGVLCRSDGLVVDHLYAVEVVVVDRSGTARAVIATRDPGDPNHDLWWAHTGGGGGSFGVVTRYWFRTPGTTSNDPTQVLPRPPGEVLISAISWPWSELTEAKFAALVRNYGDWMVAHAEPGGPYTGLTSFLNLNHRSSGHVDLLTIVDATGPRSKRLLADYLDAVSADVGVPPGPVTSSEHGPLTEFVVPQRWGWLKASRFLGTGHTRIVNPALRGEYKSAYHRQNYTEAQIATLYRNLTRGDLDNPTAVAQLSSYGGQVNALDRTATAQVHRDSAFKVLYEAHWSVPEDDAANIAWLREFYLELYEATGGVPVSNAQTDGCYIGYCDIDLNDPTYNRSNVAWHQLYWGENYERLQEVKAAWDPTDFFRNGQSVRLP